MKNLRLSPKNIRKLIDLKTDCWICPTSTNCYAFALGLDVPSSKISNHAYQLGCFSEDYLKKRKTDVYSLNREERLSYDLDSLGLSYIEVEPDCKIDNIDTKYPSFLIAYFEGKMDFHFLRKNNYDNIWYHKRGYLNFVGNRDDDKQIITNPKEAFFTRYDYVKTLKISFKK